MTFDDKIIDLAQNSAFYKDAERMYRIQYTNATDACFNVLDEETGEEYEIMTCDVTPADSFLY